AVGQPGVRDRADALERRSGLRRPGVDHGPRDPPRPRHVPRGLLERSSHPVRRSVPLHAGLDRFTGSFQLQHHPVKWFTHRITFGVERTREENSELYARVDSLVSNPTFESDALGYIALNNRANDNTTVDYAATASFDLSPTPSSTSASVSSSSRGSICST